MGKSKMIAKSCPKCDMQVAVASKTCKCGHKFFSTRRSLDVSPSDEQRRRTARVTRQRDFYDSQDYQKKKRRSPKKRSVSRGSDEERTTKVKDKESAAARARRRRALRRAVESSNHSNNSSSSQPTPQLKPNQIAICQVILAEINRKMNAVVWRPDV